MSTTFANSINSNLIYADRAEKDAAGNNISTTYATKSELPEGVPAVTSADNNKVLKASYSEGTGSYSWQTESGGGGGTTYTAGDGIDITSDVISADVDGTTIGIDSSTKKIKLLSTIPSVDQTYSAASANAQSGTAVAGALAGKEDAFDVGTGLEMDTSGATPTLQVEAPVDIVAGPGITIDNPDGNTLRVSVAQNEEVVLCDTVSNSSCTLSEAYTNFGRIRIEWQYGSSLTDTEFSIVPMLSEYYTDAITATTNKNVLMTVTNLNGNGSSASQFVTRAALWRFNGTTTFEFVKGYQLFNGNVTASTAIHIRRIIGIHRIANN